MLRQWTMFNATRADALLVTEFGINTAIQGGVYSPNALVFRQLAVPLTFSPSSQQQKALIRTFDIHVPTIEAAGPTTEYVRLQLILATAEVRLDSAAAERRLYELYEYVQGIENIYTRAESCAWYLNSLAALDTEGRIEKQLGLRAALERDLDSDLADLLDRTADHHEAAKRIVKALAIHKFDLGLSIIGRLNTERRRDEVMDDLLEGLLRVPDVQLDAEHIASVFDQYSDGDLRANAICSALERAAQVTNPAGEFGKRFGVLLGRIRDIKSLPARCQACADAYTFLAGQPPADEQMLGTVLAWLRGAWEGIDRGWKRDQTAFRIARAMARCNIAVAQGYVAAVKAARGASGSGSNFPAQAFILSLQLAIRAWTGLLHTQQAHQDAFRRLAIAIDRIPAAAERTWLYSDLAVRYAMSGNSVECRRIVLEHVDPLLRSMTCDQMEFEVSLVRAFPALYFTYKNGAFDRLNKLGERADRDRAYSDLCEALLRKQDPAEPFDRVLRRGYLVDHPDLLEVVSVIARMDEDALLYRYIEAVCDTIADASRTRITREQANEYPDRLLAIINECFPNPRFIRHNGYKIAATAQVYRIRSVGKPQWEGLIADARAIVNVADRAYVLTIVAAALPSKEATLRRSTIREARRLIDSLPAGVDKISRYTAISELMIDDADLSKECLRAAMEVAVTKSESEALSIQRRVVDLAYRISPDFASSLVSLIDDDPAKARLRREVDARIDTLRVRQELGGSRESLQNNGRLKREPRLPDAAWLKLGSLNADSTLCRLPQDIAPLAEAAASFPITQAYPIMAWVIENSVVRYGGGAHAASRLMPVFDATLLTSELAQRLGNRSVVHVEVGQQVMSAMEGTNVRIVGPGGREEAFEFMLAWIEQFGRDIVKIIDPFFSVGDLRFLNQIKSVRPDLRIEVLTSKKQQNQERLQPTFQEAFTHHWRINVSQDPAPETEIWIAGVGDAGAPLIHDRWLLTRGGGMNIGTSLNSIGVSSESKLSVMSEEEFVRCEATADEYLHRRKREFRGQTVTYETVFL